MSELTQHHLAATPWRGLVLWLNRRILWLAEHWLAVANGFFGLYLGLAFLAPILRAGGYFEAADLIYRLYRIDCHQLPSRSYFIFGEQVAFCHRHVAMWTPVLVGGLLYTRLRSRLRPPALRWYVFFLVPIAVDGGLGLAGAWLHSMPLATLWAMGLVALGVTSAILHSRRYLTWHSYLFFAAGPLSLLYLQYYGPYESTWELRTLTGLIFGLGTMWFAYPHIDNFFARVRQKVSLKLADG